MTQNAPPPWGQPAPAAAPPWGAPAPAPAAAAPWGAQPAAPPAQGAWQPPPPQGSPTPPAPWGAQPAPAPAPQAPFMGQPAPMGYAPPGQVLNAPPQGYAPPGPPPGYGAPPQGYAAPPGYGGQPYGAPPAQAFAAPSMGGDVLDGVAGAKTRANNPWFPLGNFVVDLDVLKMFASKDPDKLGHIMIVGEFKIVWSDQATAVPGNTYSETLDLNKYGLSDWQNLITALYGGTPGVPEHIQHCTAQGYYSKANQLALCGEGQPKRGTRLRLWTHMNKGGTFTKHEWLPMPPG